ncbi:uncharacterized protein C7orf50 homolog isoform X2 [Gadus macrocephalus]|uniref:uncharacterized protein C7orf50 homolog isoform X2 n=1 Tax=Gadus macrocephalus TaxID=80720 RepID=UPI0028CBB327|nr:uncharacterized protein C7orf50 homolog isoform X2 [Gadus macrocephalus]
MAKDKPNGIGTKGSDEVESVKRKKDRKLEKKSKKMKLEESEQEVPELLVKHKKPKKNSREEEKEAPQEVTEPAQEGEEPNPEERRVLERKLKKIRRKEEKAQLKAEGKTVEKAAPEKVLPSQQALDYLTCWNENRAAWKFQKLRQTWLLQHIHDSEEVPDESFPVLLLYIEGLRGAARDLTVQKAEALVKSLGDGPWDPEQQQKMQRAREVLQLLS